MTEEHIDLVSVPQEPVSEIDQLRGELEESKNRALRAWAELENYRARVKRQVEEERKYACIDFMRELLSVWDNIGRALEAVETTQNLETLVQGMQLVHSQFLEVLQKYHCEKIEAKFQPFDPNVHASVAQIPSAEHPANTIIEEIQTGFRLFDRVVRPSQVVVSSKVEP